MAAGCLSITDMPRPLNYTQGQTTTLNAIVSHFNVILWVLRAIKSERINQMKLNKNWLKKVTQLRSDYATFSQYDFFVSICIAF